MLKLAIALQRLPFLRSRDHVLLQEVLSGIEDLRHFSAADLLQMCGRPHRGQQFDADALFAQLERDMELMSLQAIRPIHIWSSEYPALLREIADPPVVLYVRGSLPSVPFVSVVGTRRPTTEGRRAAYRLGYDLAKMGYSVVSGLALGIDGHAHQGAVDAGGHTLAVLGSGIDQIVPRSHIRLASGILRNAGAICSEFPPATPPAKYRFPQRNRIIAALSPVLVVVEAPRGSGALITADFAADSREVLVHRAGYDSFMGDGCRELVCNGARIIESARQVFPSLGKDVCGGGMSLGEPEVVYEF